jgi:hypothetical protein
MFGFTIGSMIAQVAGAWAYHTSKKHLGVRELLAALAAGLTTMVVASVVYIPFRAHEWLAGPGARWEISVFLALCMGIVQGVLLRGRPLGRRLTSA